MPVSVYISLSSSSSSAFFPEQYIPSVQYLLKHQYSESTSNFYNKPTLLASENIYHLHIFQHLFSVSIESKYQPSEIQKPPTNTSNTPIPLPHHSLRGSPLHRATFAHCFSQAYIDFSIVHSRGTIFLAPFYRPRQQTLISYKFPTLPL